MFPDHDDLFLLKLRLWRSRGYKKIDSECGRELIFTHQSRVYRFIIANVLMQTAAHVLWSLLWGALDPILLLWCPLNSCLCISSLLSHKWCSGLFISFFFFLHYSSGISSFLFLISSPFVVPAPSWPPTSHIPLLKDGGCFVCMCVSSGCLKREGFDPFLSFLCIQDSFVPLPTCFWSDYTAQVYFYVFRFSL